MKEMMTDYKKVVNSEILDRRISEDGLLHGRGLHEVSPLINSPIDMSEQLEMFINFPLMLLEEEYIFD